MSDLSPVDSPSPPARWTDGEPTFPRRPANSSDLDSGGAVITLDCGHTFAVGSDWFADGWGEWSFVCPFEHATVWDRSDGRGIREIAPRVAEAEERLRRAKRLASGDDGARLFAEMEELLREMYESQAIVMDGETDEARAHRRNGMRRGFDKIGPLLARIGGAK